MSSEKPLNELSACDAASMIAAGKITSRDLVRACLDRIERREPELKAWAYIDPEQALADAEARDKTQAAGEPLGPLHGVPVGVKDVIDVAGQPTGMGSRIYDGYRPFADASCVARVRQAGAVILGKTVTCEFAGMHPGTTTNPHDNARTPGGSSSGSGAAVADNMVALAYGTQTGGSIIRPAAFCGVVGYKPTYGTINRAGLKFAAESLDTIGFLARTIDDVALMRAAHVGPGGKALELAGPPRIGVCRTHLWEEKAAKETRDAIETVAARLSELGAATTDVTLSEKLTAVSDLRNVLDNVERAHAMAFEWAHHRSAISDILKERIELGLKTPADTYDRAKASLDEARRIFDGLFAEIDILLTPSTSGEAPAGLHFTGDPAFQSLWTALHGPTITLPYARGPNGMPLGIQLVAPRWQDDKLFKLARWVSDKLALAA